MPCTTQPLPLPYSGPSHSVSPGAAYRVESIVCLPARCVRPDTKTRRSNAAQADSIGRCHGVIHPKPASRKHRRAGAGPISYFLSPLCKSSEQFSKASESGVCCDASWPPPPTSSGLHAPHSPWKCVTLCFPCGVVSPSFNSPPLCLQSRLEPRQTLFVSAFGNGGGGGRGRCESAVGEGVVCGEGTGMGRGRGC